MIVLMLKPECFEAPRLMHGNRDMRGVAMKKVVYRTLGGPKMTRGIIRAVVVSAVFLAFAPAIALADPMPSKGTTPYVTHFVFRPLESIDVPGFRGTVHEMVGTTQNMKGEKMLDKMAARCLAVDVDSGSKKYIDGACVLTDADGDKIFSTFDTRDVDKSMGEKGACGTHTITGGSGKYAGITGKEPFSCEAMPALAGGGGYTSLDIPHTTSWEIQ